MRTQVFRVEQVDHYSQEDKRGIRIFRRPSWTVMLAEVNKDRSIIRPIKVWRRYTTERAAKQAANAMYRNEDPDIKRVAVIEL